MDQKVILRKTLRTKIFFRNFSGTVPPKSLCKDFIKEKKKMTVRKLYKYSKVLLDEEIVSFRFPILKLHLHLNC